MTGAGRLGLLAALLVAGLLGVVAFSGSGIDAATANATPANATPANGTVVHHENPEDVGDGSGKAGIRERLLDMLDEQVRRGFTNLDQGDYERAREALGPEYEAVLDQYRNLSTGEDESIRALRRARELQAAYLDAIETYRDRLATYRSLSGNATSEERRVRSVARQVVDLAREVNRTGRRLVRHYENVSMATGAEFRSVASIRNTTQEVHERTTAIRAEVFTATHLRVRADATRISFREPLRVSGTLQTATGARLPNRTILLQTPARTLETRTDATGTFTLTYRPAMLPRNVTRVAVRYVPADGSAYLGANATIDVAVTPVEPSIELTRRPGTIAYNETLRVRAAVTVDGHPVAHVPVAIAVEGRRLGRVRTRPNGTVATALRFPGDVPAGRATLSVGLPIEGRAIAATNATRRLDVGLTNTTLRITRTNRTADLVTVRGRLTTGDGAGLVDRRVALYLGKRAAGRTTTGEGGWFETAIALPRDAREGSTVSIRARFVAGETNLGGSNATTTLSVPASPNGGVDPVWVLAGGATLLVSLVGYWLRSRPDGSEQASTERSAPADSDREGGAGDVLAAARDRLDAGEAEDAVRAGYLAARRQLADSIESGGVETHWEFYRACRDAGIDEDRLAALREVTRAYERAAFAPETLSTGQAEAALETVERIRGDREIT